MNPETIFGWAFAILAASLAGGVAVIVILLVVFALWFVYVAIKY